MNTKQKVIMDVDPGIDDSLAIVFAGMAKQIELLGLTVVSGNIEVNQAARNAIKALQMCGRENVPVYKGEALPLKREYFDATDTHGKDGVGENFFQVEECCETMSADDFIIRELTQDPGEITILALGPLTNLAKVIEKDAQALKKAKQIIIMGGAATIHGNCSPVAEYNFWVDPHAAAFFFARDYENVVLVPLDVTYSILLTPNMREMVRQLGTELSEYVYQITGFYVDFHWAQERTLGCIINDPLTVAYLLKPEILQLLPAGVQVETEGLCLGQSVCDFFKENANTKVARGVKAEEFFRLFWLTIFPEKESDILLMYRKGYL